MKRNASVVKTGISLFICLCILMSFGVWIHNCTHDCSGEDCVICQDILLLRNQLTTGKLFLFLFSMILPVLFPVFCTWNLQKFPLCDSPVLRKVKLTI